MEIVEQIGTYAGFAAVVGLAVLAALYFSQARDVRRLREWAGRAPERAAQHEAALRAAQEQAAVQAARAQQTVRATPQPAATRTAPVVAAAGQGAAGAPATEERPAAAGATPAAPAKPPTVPAQPAAPLPPVTPSAPLPEPPVPPAVRPKRKLPWYRRVQWPAPRYLALLVGGILIVGGGAAYGVSELLGEEEPARGGRDGSERAQKRRRPPPVNRSTVTVSVLNGTTIPGLAATVGDKVGARGYQLGNVTNATEQERAESVALYAGGAAREARTVARDLGISQIEPIDPGSQALGGNASVVVIVGADQTQ